MHAVQRVVLASLVATSSAVAWLALGCKSDTPGAVAAGSDAGDALPPADAPTDAPILTTPSAPHVFYDGPATLWGTTRAEVIYNPSGDFSLYARPFLGGEDSVAMTGSTGSYIDPITVGDVFVLIDDYSSPSYLGRLRFWSHATGAQEAPGKARPARTPFDGTSSHLLYRRPMNATIEDIVVASSDFSNVAPLLSAVSSSQKIQLAWMGARRDTPVATFSRVATDAGSGFIGVSAFAPGSWIERVLSTHLDDLPFLTSADGASVAAITVTTVPTPSRDVVVFPVAGGSPTRIDSGHVLGAFLRDGRIVYASDAELRVSPSAAPSPQTLVNTTVGYFGAPSPDEKWIMYTAGNGLFVTSTDTPGQTIALGSAGRFYGNEYTGDSRYVVTITNYQNQTLSGTLTATPLDGGTPRVVAPAVYQAWALSGSQLLFVDHTTLDGTALVGDLEWIDLASSDPPRTIVPGFKSIALVSGDKKHVVYGDSTGTFWLYIVDFP